MSELQEKQKEHVQKFTAGLYRVYCVLMVIIGLAVAPNTTILDKLCILGICLVLAPLLNLMIDGIWKLGGAIKKKIEGVDQKALPQKS